MSAADRLLSGIAIAAAMCAWACVPPELSVGSGANGGAGAQAGGGAGAAGGAGASSSGSAGSAGGTTSTMTSSDPYGDCLEVCEAAGGKCEMSGACVFDCGLDASCSATVVCPAGVPCRVDCGGQQSCSGGVDCSAASACEVFCDGGKSCKGVVNMPVQMKCSAAACAIHCSGVETCQEAVFDCAGQYCDVECDGTTPAACYTATCKGKCRFECSAEESCHKVSCEGGPCQVKCSAPSSCAEVSCLAACACDVTCSTDACYFAPVCPKDTGVPGPCNLKQLKGCTSAPYGCDTCQ